MHFFQIQIIGENSAFKPGGTFPDESVPANLI